MNQELFEHWSKEYVLAQEIIEELWFCSCWNIYDIIINIWKYLQILKKQDWKEYENTEYMFFVYWADTMWYTEHGTTIRCSWLSSKWKKLLKKIDKINNLIK